MSIERIPDEEELLRMARQHWQKHRPGMSASLQTVGRLEEMLQTAVRQTLEAIEVLIGQGMGPVEAWEVMREEWILVPPEANDDLSLEMLSSPS